MKNPFLFAAASIVVAAFTLVTTSCKRQVSEVEYYENPVVHATAPDPSVIRADDGTFYMYATGSGYSIFRSNNMVD